MITIPSFSLGDILRFYKVIRIYTEKNEELPFICLSNTVTAPWSAPTHPTDTNVKISDTIFREPKEITLTGNVYTKNWDGFTQILKNAQSTREYSDSLIDTARAFINTTLDLDNVIGRVRGDFEKNFAPSIPTFKIVLLGGVYENYILLNVEKVEDTTQNSAFQVTLTFRENIKVKAESRVITVSESKFAQSGQTLNRGNTGLVSSVREIAENTNLVKNGVIPPLW